MDFSKTNLLYLSNYGLTEDHAVLIANKIKDNSVLSYFQIYNNALKDLGVDSLCHGLENKPKLVELHLQCVGMTGKSAEKLASVLKHMSSLQQIHLSNNSIGDEGMEKICQALEGKKITLVGFASVNMGDQAMQALAKVIESSCNMSSFDLSNNMFTHIGFNVLAEALKKNNAYITSFNLDGNKIGDEGVEKICTALKGKQISRINLNSVDMGNKGMLALAKFIEDTPSLTNFDLAYNSFTDIGLIACIEALKKNKTIIGRFNIAANSCSADAISMLFTS